MEWREIREALDACERLGHPEAYWAWRLITGSTRELCYWCDRCGPVTSRRYDHPGRAVTEAWFRERFPHIDLRSIPEVRRDVLYRVCAVCGVTTACELHHTLPRSWDRELAERHPQLAYCKSCHDEHTQAMEAYVQRRIRQARGVA